MKNLTYWKKHYIVHGNADEIERNIKLVNFTSDNENFELVSFEKGGSAPNILISPGSGGHSYVFAELAYEMFLKGFNVFIMPKHGGRTVNELMPRHLNALTHIRYNYGDRIGVFAEGLGGWVIFYLALAANESMKSMAIQNGPAIMTEEKYRRAIMSGSGPARRRRLLMPFMRVLGRIAPWLPIPLSLYLDFDSLIDTKEENRKIELNLVREGYLHDSDFDKYYPLRAVLSLISTPPPNPLSVLATPTMFMVALRGFTPEYFKDLYQRLPVAKKKMLEVDGSVYWMLSHPKEAAEVICEWFKETL